MNRKRLALAALTTLATTAVLGTWLGSASAAPVVHVSKPCASSEYKPRELIVSCADSRIVFTAAKWTNWGAKEAKAEGELSYPNCAANVPLAACKKTASDPASARLYRPVYCPRAHRTYFTRLLVLDPEASVPDLRRIKVPELCPA